MTWPYLIRLDPGDHSEDDPCDTLALRAAASNLNHLANSHGQVLVNWAVGDGKGILRTGTSTGGFELFKTLRFPLKLRPDGAPYRLRVRLRGRRTTAGEVRFWVKPNGLTGLAETYVTTVTTSAWLTPTGTGLISLTADDSSSFQQSIAAPQTLAGADIVYPEVMASIDVGVSIGGTAVAELTGLHVSEWVGL